MENLNKYGEILLLGPCNYKCYYCLQNEMDKLKEERENQLNTHYSKWNHFNDFLLCCQNESVDKIYLSSICTDPLLYNYLEELIQEIKNSNFKVGIRTNGVLAVEKINTILKLDEEISFSLNSFCGETNFKITNNTYIPDYEKIFKLLSNNNKKCRVTIVVNQYNYAEIPEIINKLNNYKCISYLQLRKVYKYYDYNKEKEDKAFENVKEWIEKNATEIENYYESKVFKYNNLKISLWENVFSKNSIKSINYFTNGIISGENLLVPIYEERKNG